MVSWTGKRISKITLYRENANQSFMKIDYEHFLFAVLYAVSMYYCYITIGEQYVEALSMYEAQEINVVDDFSNLRNRAEDYLAGKIPDPLTASAEEIKAAAGPSYVIPSKWSPGFWPSIALGVVFTAHVLFILGQKWSVSFRCLVKFSKVTQAEKATHVHVVPSAHQGKELLVPIQYTESDRTPFFDFHRRKYLFDAEADCFAKVKCRGDYPVRHYAQWTGVPSETLYAQLRELYGPNRFQMASPAFMDLYWEQVTSPFTVFQIFSTLLWCLDSYWQYSLFSFFMIFTFEATTVFSRMRSLGVIKNMGNEVQPVLVFRSKRWQQMTTEDLVPGDLFSLVKNAHVSDIIPCDAILVVGGAVVNESTLTGESIPQMKDGIVAGLAGAEAEQKVSMKGQHKTSTLFGGTRVLQVSSVAAKSSEETEELHDAAELAAATADAAARGAPNPNKDSAKSSADADAAQGLPLSLTQQYQKMVPAPPDNGCICYCVRTGFCSSQGKLVRLIETSQTTSVRGDTRDTVLLLFLLLVFALTASGYVLYRGMLENTRSRYQLLLHCILIVTSVVPPELPMQTALAVNNSLMTLMKMQLFCTEPFRVPIAGKVDTCVFDKTGTLTTDELVAVGIVPPQTRVEDLRRAHKEAMAKVEEGVHKNAAAPSKPPPQPKQRTFFGIPIPTPPQPGGPLPFALVKDTVSVAGAGMNTMAHDLATTAGAIFVLGACHSLVHIEGSVGGDPLEAAALKAVKWELHADAKDVVRPAPHTVADKPFEVRLPSARGGSSSYASRDVKLSHVKIVARHHFSSKLQRMSVVTRVAGVDGGMILVKGSPEAIGAMCTVLPDDYDAVGRDLARRGMRVIALAWRRITSEQVAACCDSRLEVERDLEFVGFVAFMCRVRKDSGDVVHQLREGGNSVAMATGDAILTGVHVAQEVGITSANKQGVLLLELRDGNTLRWADFETDLDHPTCAEFDPDALPALEAKYDLCTSGAALSCALDRYQSLGKHLHLFAVFARMRPDEKERVLSLMKESGRVTLMCGDGANDVGALRAAHVGIALLTGFGDLNGVKETPGAAAGVAAIANGEGSAAVASAVTTAKPVAPTESELDAKLSAMVVTETDQVRWISRVVYMCECVSVCVCPVDDSALCRALETIASASEFLCIRTV